MTGRSLVFEGYEASVRVVVPDHLDLADMKRHLAPELSAEETADGQVDLLLTCWNGVYHLVLDEHRYGPYRTIQNVYRGLSNGIHFLLGKRSPMTFLHAGAVEVDGAAVVFPGRSHSGKSTLVASLVEQGCGYLSDEYAILSPEGAVFPLSKPIRLRREGGTDCVNPQGVSAPRGLPCLAVILTRYEKGATWNPTPLTPGSAVLGVLPSALRSRDAPDQVLEAVSALVHSSACYEAARGDGEPTAAAIRELDGVVAPETRSASVSSV